MVPYKIFIEKVVPLLRLFLMSSMTHFFFNTIDNSSLALKLCLLNSSRFHLLPLGVSAHILYSHLVISKFSDKVKSKYIYFSVLKSIFNCIQGIKGILFFTYSIRADIKEWLVMTPTT